MRRRRRGDDKNIPNENRIIHNVFYTGCNIYIIFHVAGARRAMGAGKKQRPASKLAAAQRRVDATRGGGRPAAAAAAAAATGLQQKSSVWRVMYTHNRPGWSEINTVEGG